MKYKERPKFDINSQDNKDFYNFYRMEYYGLGESLKGQMGKFRIILRGSFEIVKFEDDFFVRNENNKKEKEYIWGGRVPLDGKMTSVTLSKREATFDIYSNIQITSRSGNIRNTTLYIPMEYIGGNNEIINMNYSSPQTKNIYVDENKRWYWIEYSWWYYRGIHGPFSEKKYLFNHIENMFNNTDYKNYIHIANYDVDLGKLLSASYGNNIPMKVFWNCCTSGAQYFNDDEKSQREVWKIE